ncbi:MAG: endonuclease domain-containing protein [Hyphomonadaceae bacterium]
MRNEQSIKRARAMRKDPTSPEERLWSMLRNRRYRDAKFRRQHAIGKYVVDFACVEIKLVIEVDGPSHSDPEQAAFDAERTNDLERWGWRVARVPNAIVYDKGDGLYDFLDRALKGED